jgi:hypothetical protein
MTVTVLDSKDLITHLTTGMTPIPAGVAEDNARQQAAADKANGKTTAIIDKVVLSEKKETTATPDEDVEGDDGLTPRQKREWTAAMLKSVGKKHREKLEAEEFAASQYNERVLADKRAEAAELERETFKAELAKLKQPAKPDPGAEPLRANFETDKAFADALIDWRVDQKFKAKEAEVMQQRQQTIQQNTEASLARAVELVPDFVEVTQAAELNIPGHIVHMMQESGLFAEFGYHFATVPEDLAKLVISTPNKIKVEFKKIEDKLTPFASRTAAGADGKVNGAKPNESKTESASTHAAVNGQGADPSTQTESTGSGAGPSKPRCTAPVFAPLSTGGASQVEKDPREMNIRETITDWQKKNQRNLTLRKRH